MKKIICILFHKIITLENCSFIDNVTGESVGKYKCCKCNKTYLANSKVSIFRVEV